MPRPVDASGDEGESRKWGRDREIRVLPVGVPYAAIKVARSLLRPHLRSSQVLSFPLGRLVLISLDCLLKAILEHQMRGHEVGEEVFSLCGIGSVGFQLLHQPLLATDYADALCEDVSGICDDHADILVVGGYSTPTQAIHPSSLALASATIPAADLNAATSGVVMFGSTQL